MIDNLTLTILLCLNPFKDPLSSFVLKVRASFFKAILKKKDLTSLSYFSYSLLNEIMKTYLFFKILRYGLVKR